MNQALYSFTFIALALATVAQPSYSNSSSNSNKMIIQAHGASDKRQSQSIAEDWQHADAVFIGTISRARANGATFQIKEALKGDTKDTGTTINIPLERYLVGAFPTNADQMLAAIFLTRDSTKKLVTSEIYADVDKISALRCLSPIFAKPSEHDRLTALGDLFSDPTSHCKTTVKQDPKALFKKEFLAAIAQMHDPKNFEIVVKLYEHADAKSKFDLLEWMANTGDRRSLPFLIAAVKSPDQNLRNAATTRLIYFYPGDTGVDKCLEETYAHGFPDTKNAAYDYLLKRGCVSALKTSEPKPTMTAYQRAETLYGEGKFKEALELYITEIQSTKNNSYVRRWSALKAIPHATVEQKERIRKALLPMLAQDATSGNYWEATDTAEILQKLHHDDCLDGLVVLLDRRDSLFAKANRIAAFAIGELEPEARRKAAQHLIAQIKSPKFSSDTNENQMITLLELAWIGDPSAYSGVDQLLATSAALPLWKSIHPLLTAKDQSSSSRSRAACCIDPTSVHRLSSDKSMDGLFLIDVLKTNPSLPHIAKDWVIVQLGIIKEERAVDLIIAHLKEMKYQYDGYVSDEALKSIGGKYVSQQVEKIAVGGEEEVSRNAVDILCEIQKEKCLPVLRQILRSAKSPAKTNALCAISRLGTPDDLPLLVPMNDYWKGDRHYHYWTMDAVASIRQRYNYNVNGPINHHS
jgi:HEAT repeat protein